MGFSLEESPSSNEFLVHSLVSLALVLTAGLMSGLTLGLLSLDSLHLEVLLKGGTPKEQKYARKIIPIVKHHHLLLVTLLLTNAAAAEALPLFLDQMFNPVLAVIISVTLVLMFSEVIPQSICARYGLAIGANLSWLVFALMILTSPVSYPIAKLLDWLLGKEQTAFFRRAELKELVKLHSSKAQETASDFHSPLSEEEVLVIHGAMELREKTPECCFTPMSSVVRLPENSLVDDSLMTHLLTHGHSRYPVYTGDNSKNLTGFILVKTLLKCSPKQSTPMKPFIRPLPRIPIGMPLYRVLKLFQNGRSHIAVVVSSEDEALGILTLEDVIEELLQSEIVDETDVYVDVAAQVKVQRIIREWSARQGSFKSLPLPAQTQIQAQAQGQSYGAVETSTTTTTVQKGMPHLSVNGDCEPSEGTTLLRQ